MEKQCEVCKDAESKYKCPTCLTPYCSLGCYKKHKAPCAMSDVNGDKAEIKVEEQPAASVAEDDESSHRLKHSQLEAVGTLLGAGMPQTSPQGPLQVTNQLSRVTQAPSSEVYESGEEEAKFESTSRKSEPKPSLKAVTTPEVAGSGSEVHATAEVHAVEEEVNQAAE